MVEKREALSRVLAKYGSAIVLPRRVTEIVCQVCGQPVCLECSRCCNVKCMNGTCQDIVVVKSMEEVK